MHKRVSQKSEPLDRTENTFITESQMVCLITPEQNRRSMNLAKQKQAMRTELT